jgi:predicted MFS family arabinose efflux permease
VLTEALGWEWIFFVNVPIGIVAIALTERRIVNVAARDAQRVDVPGLVTFSAALFLLIFGLIRGNPEGWASPQILASLIGAGVLLIAFVTIETRSSHPMLELGLFRKPAFVGLSAAAFCLSAGMFAMFLYLTIYVQGVLGYSPLDAGVIFLPLTVVSFFVAPIAAKLAERIPIRVLLGVGLATVGIGLLLMHGVDENSEWTALLAGFIVAGVGIGLTNPNIASGAIGVVPPAKAGMGSGINNTFRQAGIAMGVAALGAIFQSRVESKFAELMPGANPGLAEIVSSGGTEAAVGASPPGARTEVAQAATVAFTGAFNEILLIGGLISFAGAILGFALVRRRDFVQQGAPEGETAPEPAAA